jgi:hypothetical protein
MLSHSLFKKLLVCLVLMIFGLSTVEAQYSSISVNKKKLSYRDSIKAVKYDYIFPIWGQKVYEKGFDIPYPAGLMVNYIWMKQNIVIDNMQLGFKGANVDVPLTSINFIEFGDNVSTVNSYNFRPDIWVLPFLNVYGLFGGGISRTEVNLISPLDLQSVVEQNITTRGLGVMGAGGVGKFWFSVDGNWTWSKPELLDEPVKVKVLGIRLGKTFEFAKKPERNIAIWIGGMRTQMDTETKGQLTLNEALPQDVWDRKDEVVTNYYNWYDNEATLPQKLIADEVLTPIVEAINNRNGDGIVRYGMDKQVKQLWNGVVGGQYQMNKRWMLRSEVGFIGNRKSFLLSLNYRFLM